MNWKEENIRKRYIDDITDEEAAQLAYLCAGEPTSFSVLKVDRTVNGNVIPHVLIHFSYFEDAICEQLESRMGIFHNLNVYLNNYHSCYCQKEIFELFTKFGFE